MPTWDTRDVRQALLAKGFRYDPNEKRPHDFLRLCLPDGTVTSVSTWLSKGKKEDIAHSSPLFTRFKRELSLSTRELDALFSCPMTGEEYVHLMIARGKVKLPR